MAADQACEFLRDPFVVVLMGGVLLTGLYWSLVFALRKKGAGDGRRSCGAGRIGTPLV